MTKTKWAEGAGWAGMVAILAAYVLLSDDALAVHGWWYQGLNAFGALGIIISCIPKRNWPPLVLNSAWLLIALITTARFQF